MIRRPPRSTLFPLHDALPISTARGTLAPTPTRRRLRARRRPPQRGPPAASALPRILRRRAARQDRKSTRLNSSHANISYAVFCLKKKNKTQTTFVCDTHLIIY